MRIFVTVLCILFAFCVNAQNTNISLGNIQSDEVNFTHLLEKHFQLGLYIIPLPSPQPQPSLYKNHHPGMFCKMEYKIECKSKLAPRFRLGSLNYTNWMEGKGQLYSRYWN